MKDVSEYKITEPMSALEIIKERVIPLIQEDYRRMRMGCWLNSNNNFWPCGTVGCIAGWTTYVMGLVGHYSSDAIKLVPPTLRSEFQKSFLSELPHFHTPDGTKEQANAVIAYLKDFCERHEKALRCWIIDPTSSGIGSDDIDPYTGKEVVRCED